MKRTVAVMLITAAALSNLAWPPASWGQTKIARVGILVTTQRGPDAGDPQWDWYELFRKMLAQHDWAEGKNVSFEYRGARGNPPNFAEVAAELVKLKVDVIYADNAPATRASYAATRTIPIVGLDFTNDPVAAGYVESYGRPGRNLSGFFLDAPAFASKWLELLKVLVPRLSRLVVLWDPSPGTAHLQALQHAAQSLGVRLEVLEARLLA